MAARSMHRSRDNDPRPRVRSATWIVSLIGVVASAVGAYIVLAPADGTVKVIAWTWRTADLVAAWAPWLLVIGGSLAAIGLTVSASRGRRQGDNGWLVTGE